MRSFVVLFFLAFIYLGSAYSKPLRCQKEAEEIAKSETKIKGNFPKEQIVIANPTEMDGEDYVVYVGARANYNYFKLKLQKNCKLEKIVEVEYAQ